ncbi:MAG: signal peptide peptidase SppA, partial [Chloroflexi bacterium]|nr:signal peptide peptidase SppA [Chloroflexota bacterium]
AVIANGRNKTEDEVKTLIDQAPYAAEKAQELGLVDDIAFEDELAELLGETETEVEAENAERAADADSAIRDPQSAMARAKLLRWHEAQPLLLERPYRRPSKFIGVISLEGMIMMGPSRQPPAIPLPFMGGATAGADTLLRLLRQVEEMPDMAALILHVDSGGGSALASELITREIVRIGQKMPVLAYMGNVAASGGYHVAAPARHIMCQTGTITGSIGVFMLRPNTQKLYQHLNVNRVSLGRGERAGLYSDEAPLTTDEKAVLQRGIEDIYRAFKQVVADGRSLPFNELDPVCEGRVWSGRQALEHKLVDSHGDFVDAIRKAAELAELPTDEDYAIPAFNLHPKGDRYLPPQSFETPDLPAEIGRLLSGEWLDALRERPLLLMPYEIKFW